MSRFSVAVVVSSILSAALVSPALADGPSILYAAKKAIWRAPATGKGKPQKVISLSVDADEVTRMEVSSNGKFVLLEIGGIIAFAKLGKEITEPKALDCASHARLSPDGLCVGCLDGDGRVVIHVLKTSKRRLLAKIKPTDFGFATRTRLAIARASSITIVSVAKGKHIKKAAPFAPQAHLLVSPNGQRAVGTFWVGDGNDDDGADDHGEEKTELYGFKLDGKAAKRKLASGAIPTRWSRDSQWVITQAGDRTCVIRATGGQYKCWQGYTGIELSPDADEFLLAQKNGVKHTLFKVTMAGPRPATPVQWKTVESAAASWAK